MVPNSQQGVFASSGFVGYWRRVQKSFLDFVGSGKIVRVLDPGLFATPSYNKRLAFPTAGIVFTAISSKTRFTEWHAFRGGWVCYTNDFPNAWLRCDLIVGSSSGVPIKRGVVKVTIAATPVGKGKENKIKQEAIMKVEEAKQAVKDAKPISSSTSLVIQDSEAFQPSIPQDPKPVQTLSPTKTVIIEPTTELALGKESLRGASLSTRTSKPYPILY